MSLQVDERSRGGRSRSPADRRREDEDRRPRSHVRTSSANIVEAGVYPPANDNYRDVDPALAYEQLANYPPSAGNRGADYYHSSYHASAPSLGRPRERSPSRERVRDQSRLRAQSRDRRPDPRESSDWGKNINRERPGEFAGMYLPPKYATTVVSADSTGSPHGSRDSFHGHGRTPSTSGRDRDSSRERQQRKKDRLEDDLAYGKRPETPPSPGYHRPRPSSYHAGVGRPDDKYGEPIGRHSGRTHSPNISISSAYDLRTDDRKGGRIEAPSVVTIEPPHVSGSSYPSSPGRGRHEDDGKLPLKSAMRPGREKSPLPPTNRMSLLSVNGHNPHMSNGNLSVANAPASPMLESYHGTYQSMSPMPSPLMLPTQPGPNGSSYSFVEPLSPLYGSSSSDDEHHRKGGGSGGGEKKGHARTHSRRARFHDPIDDAARLANALKGESRAPDTPVLIEILPGLTHEQVMDLRSEYKRLVKTGAERRGVNIAKHIRARLKDEDPTLMKACYTVALGRWESEAYWANFWYHGDKTRRELLIESLMGRTNEEICKIKAGFSDKKYGDSLVKCMKMELKEDKFKKAVLMVLEEKRQEDVDRFGHPLRLDLELVADDVRTLRDAIKSERGGESAMLAIVVMRSETHLKEVMRVYKETYKGANFARDALKKSGNLVGEVLAHILNGVINKPVRDAMLLNHALTLSKRDELRRELLISRLVRFHWDAGHMSRVKKAYHEHYGQDLQEAVKEATSGEWGEFCGQLCVSRMPDDVKKIERRPTDDF
ncbi:annexin ANXC4 [Neurospora intermedia]|uniref:Annexin ANXC4 n=1 Tax=Neurospora intermedia TaxID=5142 RepID=A0ABR3CY14_NEUIN